MAHIRIEPLERGAGFEFVDAVVGGAIPRQFIPAVEKGVRRAMRQGGVFGFPVVDVRVICDDGKFHPVDSSEASFERPARSPSARRFAQPSPCALEPISRVEMTVPPRYLGDVLGDVNASAAAVLTTETNERGRAGDRRARADERARRYAIELRALSGAYGTFVAFHDHYWEAPHHVIESLEHLDHAK